MKLPTTGLSEKAGVPTPGYEPQYILSKVCGTGDVR